MGYAILTFLFNGCATMDVGKAWEDLKTHVVPCKTKYGYDPDNSPGIGEDQLAQKENVWEVQ